MEEAGTSNSARHQQKRTLITEASTLAKVCKTDEDNNMEPSSAVPNSAAVEEDLHILSILSNPLMSEKIVSNLNFTDMKVASEVCRDFHQMIRSSGHFCRRAVLVVTNNEDVEETLKASTQPWRELRMEVPLPLKIVGVMVHILSTIETLSIVPSENFSPSKITQLNVFIIEVFSSIPRLTRLQVDIKIIAEKIFRDMPSAATQQTLSNLKSFEILEWNANRRSFKASNAISSCDVLSNWGPTKMSEEEGPTRSLFELGIFTKSLESFRMSKAITQTRGWGDSQYIVGLIPPVLQNNLANLRDLALHSKVWKIDEMKSVKFPNLKQLTALVDKGDREVLTNFINRHVTLEQLDVGVKGNFPKSMFSVVQKRSPKLTKLHITARGFSGFSRKVDWNFLGNMKNLKDFKIVRTHIRRLPLNMSADVFGTGPRFLTALPKNQLEKLSLRGLSRIGFWKSARSGEEHDLQYKTELLQEFSSLKSLSLTHCHQAVNDDLLQFILKEFKNLEELELSHCELTDFGLSGTKMDQHGNFTETGVTLKNLKALKRLSLRECYSLTLDDIASSVSLKNLQNFEFEHHCTVPEEFVKDIVSKNPSLEILAVPLYILENLVSAPILQRKLRETTKRCIRLVNMNDDRLCESDSDSDSDADSSESEDDGRDSPISGSSDDSGCGDDWRFQWNLDLEFANRHRRCPCVYCVHNANPDDSD